MPGQKTAIKTGAQLKREVMMLADRLGLRAREEVKVGRRLWGAIRSIDVVLTDPKTSKMLGIECKAQAGGGSAEERSRRQFKTLWLGQFRGSLSSPDRFFAKYARILALDWPGGGDGRSEIVLGTLLRNYGGNRVTSINPPFFAL